MPARIQRQRTKGWRMPEDAIYVGRGTKWGNPWVVGSAVKITDGHSSHTLPTLSASQAVHLYRLWATCASAWDVPSYNGRLMWTELSGKDLACWCPLDQPCHADVLLELANG